MIPSKTKTYIFFKVFKCVPSWSNKEPHKIDFRVFILWYHHLVVHSHNGRPSNEL